MPFDLTLPMFAVAALAFAGTLGWTLTWAGRFVPVPRIKVRAQNEKHGPLRVIELALVLSPAGRIRQRAQGAQAARGAEFVVYITLKTCNP
ncbi:MAG TPA: hypothetical protein VGN85_04925 [Methyloceanibacter sp.]|jgi:hypothetical protein|nr:hypothetical protein [Methyloceanibacter sp.]